MAVLAKQAFGNSGAAWLHLFKRVGDSLSGAFAHEDHCERLLEELFGLDANSWQPGK